MIRRTDLLCAGVLALALVGGSGVAAAAEARWLTGEVYATEGEAIFTPPSNSSPVVLRYYVPEGARVEVGDVLVRIDPGEAATQVIALQAQIEQLRAQAAKDVAELDVKAADAELAFLDAEAAWAKARVDAGIPRQHLSALDADRFQGELQRSEREYRLKQTEWQAAVAAVGRRRDDAALELDKLQAELAFYQADLGTAEQRATRAGVVIHTFDNWRGTRFDEGSSAFPGNRIGDVVADGEMGVRAWVLEPDRVGLQVGQTVLLQFDAYPGVRGRGRIARIAGAPEPKAEWGSGRYFNVEIAIEEVAGVDLLSGMNVRIETPAEAGP